MKRFMLIAGFAVAGIGAASLPFGRGGAATHTIDLFTFDRGLFKSGGITLLGIGLLIIFFAALIPRRP